MTLEDYIYNIKNPWKRMEVETKFTTAEIDYYDNISDDKKQLLREVYPYLKEDMFMDALERYEKEVSEYAYYQTYFNKGSRMLIRIKICNLSGSEGKFVAVPRESFDKAYNRFEKIGVQKYACAQFLASRDAFDPHYDRYVRVYYLEDGNVFLDSSVANEIAKMDIHTLGRNLARFCIEHEQKNENHVYTRVRK